MHVLSVLVPVAQAFNFSLISRLNKMSRQQACEDWENKLKGKVLLQNGVETTVGENEVIDFFELTHYLV